MQKYSVLVNSCDSFEDCWDPFFTLFYKYWPNCKAPIYLNTEKKNWSYGNSRVICTHVQKNSHKKLTWSECLLAALDQIDTPLVLYFQEDYFIDKPVKTELVLAAVDYMISNPEVKHIGLTRHGSLGPHDPYKIYWLLQIRQKAKYRISTQAALWRVETLKSYLQARENGWMFEIYGTWRAHRKIETFLSLNYENSIGPAIDYLHTGIIKGKWLPEIMHVFDKNQIKIDYLKRGFYIPKHPIFHKWEVLQKLLKDPIYLIKQLF